MKRFYQPPLVFVARAACAMLALTFIAGCARAQQPNGETVMPRNAAPQPISELEVYE